MIWILLSLHYLPVLLSFMHASLLVLVVSIYSTSYVTLILTHAFAVVASLLILSVIDGYLSLYFEAEQSSIFQTLRECISGIIQYTLYFVPTFFQAGRIGQFGSTEMYSHNHDACICQFRAG
jgi:ABC-type siderophore export system fused ATPase/permease subunit